jgi:diguanylate cyclase (GGDEF)-like protein
MPTVKRKQPTIGILVGWSILAGRMPDRYLISVLNGIQSAARTNQCHLLLALGLGRVTNPTGIHPAWPVASPDSDFVPVGPWNADGLIVFAPLLHEARSRYLRELSDQGYPVLFIATGNGEPAISVDNASGIRQAVAHLVGHGHRNIGFIAGDPYDTGDSASRLAAYRAAVAELELSDDPRLVAEGWHTFSGGYAAAKRIIASGATCTALVVSDDSSAIGAMQAIRDAGLRIPRDLAVIGFDDQPDALAQVPPLASIGAPLAEVGQQALTSMLAHLRGERALESLQLPTALTPRQSCGCAPRVLSSLVAPERRLAAPAGVHGARKDAAHARPEALVEQVIASVLTEAGLPRHERTARLGAELAQAFATRLRAGSSAGFQTTLMEVLQELELAGDAVDPWQEYISALRRRMNQLPADWQRADTRRLAEDMLHQARTAISESAQRQVYQQQYHKDIAAHSLSELTAQLSVTLDQQQAVEVLDTYLADIGIRHARVALFEAEEADPFAWSVVLNSQSETPGERFASRAFPPPALYPPDELLNLALVPLVFQDETLGYVAFDAHNLEPCAMIARQLAATFKAARLHAQVHELSLTDALTGVYNRRYFDLFLANEVDRSQRFGRGLAIIMLDVDHFKAYNDTFGHPAGDQALQWIARRIRQLRRRADVIARIGGEEFALILPETDAAGAHEVASRIHAAVASADDLQPPITISVGISILHGADVVADVLIQQADRALYEAKRAGRNRICVFDQLAGLP